MTTIYVQFAGATDATVISYLNSPQNSASFPNQGSMEDSDPRWWAYWKSIPSFFRASLPAPDGTDPDPSISPIE